MATAVEVEEKRITIPIEQRFVLYNITWAQYVAFSDTLGERHIRITYDRGAMELMTTSHEHERAKKRLARLVETLTEELEIDIASGGSFTCRREDLERGMEPDECYWIEHEAEVRDRNEIDFTRDPPPDLVIESEISRSILNRLGILAALRVPEVWRFDGRRVRVLLLNEEGRYVESERSRAFPFLPMDEMTRFLTPAEGQSETQLLRSFRAWVRERAAQGWKPPAGP